MPVAPPAETLTVDDLTLEVRRSSRRQTLEIIVDRGGELVVAAPENLADDAIADFVREKRFWLYTKLAEKEARQQPVRTKEFVTGEGFPYLGRSYRLLLVDNQGIPLTLMGGRFRLLRRDADSGREHFVDWYTSRGLRWLKQRTKGWSARLGVKPKAVTVRDLGFRWGSCGKGGTVNFHWATIMLPPTIVDYIIVHELVHLHEPNHTPEFWTRVERAMPDYEQRKQWLAERGGEYVALRGDYRLRK